MTIQFKDIDARGVVCVTTFAGCTVEFGVHADIVKLLQPAFTKLTEGSLESTGTYRINTKPEQPIMALMFQAEECLDVKPMDFQAYPIGIDEGEECGLFIAEDAGYKYIAFGPMSSAANFTVDKAPEGGLGSLVIADDEWEQFITDFQALVCED